MCWGPGQVKDILAKEALDVLVFAEIGMDPHSYALAFGRYAPIQIVMHGIPQPYPSTLPLLICASTLCASTLHRQHSKPEAPGLRHKTKTQDQGARAKTQDQGWRSTIDH